MIFDILSATCGLAICKILDEGDSVAFNAGCLKDTYIHRSVFTNEHLEDLDVGNSGIFVSHTWTKNLSSYNNLYPNLSEKHLEDIPSTITPHVTYMNPNIRPPKAIKYATTDSSISHQT